MTQWNKGNKDRLSVSYWSPRWSTHSLVPLGDIIWNYFVWEEEASCFSYLDFKLSTFFFSLSNDVKFHIPQILQCNDFLLHSQWYTTITTVFKSRIFASRQKETLYPGGSHSPFSSLLKQWQSLLFIQSLWVCLFWEFYN